MSTLEQIKQALANHVLFKKIGQQLEEQPPDSEAAQYLIREYRRGNVEDWLVTYFLGCIGHETGYPLVRELLLEGKGRGYAGVALAKIRGEPAYEDLLGIMFDGEIGPIRREAANGVAALARATTAEEFKKAYQRGLLLRSRVAWHIADCGPNDTFLLALLHSSDVNDQKLALGIIELLVARTRATPSPGREVMQATRACLESEQMQKISRLRRQNLTAWIQATTSD